MTRVCALTELDDGKPFAADVDGEPIVLVRQGAEVHALRDECTHAELQLSDGEVTPKGIECFLHGSCFDLRTGAPSSPPATEPVDVYEVRIVDDDVHVDVEHRIN